MAKSLHYFSLLFFIVFTIKTSAQVTKSKSPSEYDFLKSQGKLEEGVNYVLTEQLNVSMPQKSIISVNQIDSFGTNQCSCIIPLDSTFSVAEFSGYNSANQYRNDDASTPAILLPFNFNFYGTNYNSVFINNNGNVSFTSAYSAFSASGFPSSIFKMIAPFWADVDTRNVASGVVYYKITNDYMIVKWDSVGYYNSHADKVNSFQLIISNGNDSLIPGNNNVAFCYGDMQWTTGDASNGVNGFGGIPSTIGINEGNGISFAQITRSDSIGFACDGPYGLNDGVDWLDNQSFFFNVSSSTNIPAIAYDNVCDTVIVVSNFYQNEIFVNAMDAGDTAQMIITHLPDGMTVSIDSSASCLRLGITYSPTASGIDSLRFNFWDTNNPNQVFTYQQKYDVISFLPVSIKQDFKNSGFEIYPNPAQNTLNIINSDEKPLEKVIIYDNIGKKMLEFKNVQLIDISSLPKGFYLIELQGKSEIKYLRKFIKE